MIPNSVLQSAPVNPVVTLDEAKNFLRVDGNSDDSLITAIVAAATSRLESYCDRKFITQTWDIFFDHFPFENKGPWWDGVQDGAIGEMISPRRHIDLPFGPMSSVTHFKTYDDADTAYLFASSEYSIDTKGPFGRIALRSSAVWPATVLRPINGIEIRAVFGYGVNSTSVPAPIKQAILNLAAVMHEHRGDELPVIPASVSLLLEPFRRIKIGR